jgi:predicted metal-dependent phosphoesterase TrpH
MAKRKIVRKQANDTRRSGSKRPTVPKPRRAATPVAATTPARLPRDPKGRRAQFYPDPAIDQLWAVVTALTGEVSVAFDRLDTLERLLDSGVAVTRDAIEGYRPDEAASAERARRREELIQRVFQVLSQYGR